MSNERTVRILKLNEASNRQSFAGLLASETKFSIAEVQAILRAAPIEGATPDDQAQSESDGRAVASLAKSVGLAGFS